MTHTHTYITLVLHKHQSSFYAMRSIFSDQSRTKLVIITSNMPRFFFIYAYFKRKKKLYINHKKT